MADVVTDYDAVLATVSEKFDKKLLKQKKNLKVISNYAVGLDNIDVKYAESVGITVYNTPDVVTNSTADLTFAIFLSLIRKILFASEFVKKEMESMGPGIVSWRRIKRQSIWNLRFWQNWTGSCTKSGGFWAENYLLQSL